MGGKEVDLALKNVMLCIYSLSFFVYSKLIFFGLFCLDSLIYFLSLIDCCSYLYFNKCSLRGDIFPPLWVVPWKSYSVLSYTLFFTLPIFAGSWWFIKNSFLCIPAMGVKFLFSNINFSLFGSCLLSNFLFRFIVFAWFLPLLFS